MKRVWLLVSFGFLMSVFFTTDALAWTRIWTDSPQSGAITAYVGPDPQETKDWACRKKYVLEGDKRCWGASQSVLLEGDAAVHYLSSQTDPVAAWGSVVSLPSAVTLYRPDNTMRTSNKFVVADTGTGGSTSGNGWVDIYCGDDWQSSPNFNLYTWNNVQQVVGTFSGSSYTIYFDIWPATL